MYQFYIERSLDDFIHKAYTTGEIPPYFYQHITDLAFRRIIKGGNGLVQKEQTYEIVPLTFEEEIALRYAAEYVCNGVTKQLNKSSDPRKARRPHNVHATVASGDSRRERTF